MSKKYSPYIPYYIREKERIFKAIVYYWETMAVEKPTDSCAHAHTHYPPKLNKIFKNLQEEITPNYSYIYRNINGLTIFIYKQAWLKGIQL